MIQDRGIYSNIDTDDILSLLAEWDAEYFIDTPSTFHMREYYALKTQSHDPDRIRNSPQWYNPGFGAAR